MIVIIRLISLSVVLMLVACSTTSALNLEAGIASSPKRVFSPVVKGRWIGKGISYSAYRDGETPNGDRLTAKTDILEDLTILSRRWNLIRLYGSGQQSRNILEVIRDNNLPMRVMQGVWLSKHQTESENNQQVNQAIELSNQFPEIIVAVNVGNEIFVDWSWHRLDDMDRVITQIRQVRANISQPVTVSDDYNFWNKPQAKSIAAEIDFICLHAYAFWNNKTLDIAMQWTKSIYEDIQARHPQHLIAYCETGWPTSRIYADGSYEGGLTGRAGEAEQKVFFDQYEAWAGREGIISFYFSSFDEQWKGGFDGAHAMEKAEKHWGLYDSGRKPKMALQ